MLNLIPIVFVLTAIVGVIVIVVRHLPELRQVESQTSRPSWAAEVSIKSLSMSFWRKLASLPRYTTRALKFAKSEVKNSRDITRHWSQSLRDRFERRRPGAIVVRREEVDEDPSGLADAERLFEQGQYVAAEEAAIELLKDNPSYKPAYELLGEIYMARKSFLEAVEVYRYLLRLMPASEKNWRAIADSFVGLEDYGEAIKAYRKSIEFYASPEVFVSLGLAYQAAGDYVSAGKAFESALDIEPENTQVMMILAENLVHRNETESALEVLEQILELEPGNMIARERLMKLKI